MSSQMFKTFEEQHNYMDPVLAATSKTLDPFLQTQLKTKYQKFAGFNYREAYLDSKQKRKRKSDQAKVIQSDIGQALQLYLKSLLVQEPKKKSKNISFVQQLPGVKSERRERFKKGINTFLIIKHYIQKQNFKPKEEQMYLMKQLAQIKQSSDQSNLDLLLKRIYRIMNEAVDLNQMRFLCLLIMLAADVCFYFRQFNRAFYFYNEARIFCSYSNLTSIKIQALMQLGIIALELKHYPQSIILLKKALQYAWDCKNQQAELFIYDYLGNVYYYQGNIKQSQYYHKRFTQGQHQKNDSAIKRISSQMLHQYRQNLKPLQTTHLTSLFLEYIKIPIFSHQEIPPPTEYKNKSYQNYDQNGHSPRKKRSSRQYESQNYTDVDKQLFSLLSEDFQFTTEIPNPDVQRNFIITQKFGRPRKEIMFQQSAGFHKITHSAEPKIDLKTLQVNTFERRLEKALNSQLDSNWWEQMKQKIKKNQVQKIGQMKDRIYNSHQSYNKYPQERRRVNSYKGQKIKESFNKTLLDWIDPLK